MAEITLYGAPWCPDCTRSKKFLAEHRVAFDWMDIDQDGEARRFVGHDGWRSIEDIPSAPIGLGMHGVRFAPSDLRALSQLHFTRFFPGEGRREGTDHFISIGHAP